MNINDLLRRIKLNPYADFSDLPPRQKEALQAISQMIANGEGREEKRNTKRREKENLKTRRDDG
ncbi:unnamed protein product [marine sediment metagenome]|jgi:hypothetical protein|uniref:Uncharacterized protein n=1 Tax=marine sediment metagenome TaxID=412755 RepID=X1HZW4_9ZZZZ